MKNHSRFIACRQTILAITNVKTSKCIQFFPGFKSLLFGFLVFFNFNVFAAGKITETDNATVSPASVGGTTTGSATVCSDHNSGAITLSGQVGAVVRWEFSTNAGISWDPIVNTTTTQDYLNLTQTTKYRAVVQSGLTNPANSTIATITVTAAPSATISYAGSPYCSNGISAVVTRTGTAGGTYTSTAGLGIAATTGKITLGTSVPGTYIVTYTIVASGGCDVYTTTATVTITPKPSATISYDATPYCSNAGIATVARTGTPGGTYSSTVGLAIDPGTGDIALGTSTPGTYVVTYTVAAAGGCSVYTTTTSVTINAAPSATISYTGSPYCANTITATVTRTGTAYGTYSSTAGLSINSLTGKVSIGTSVPGTYIVTYTIEASAGCTAYTTTTSISIIPDPAATIDYTGSPYCSNAGIATVTTTGTPGGTFSSTAGLAINPTTGDITLGASIAGTYTVTYTVGGSGGCLVYTKTTSVTISDPSLATISYDGGPFCSASGAAFVTRTGAPGGTYSSTAGLTIAPTTGKITLTTSIAGTYVVTYTMVNGGCTTTATASVTVNATASATIAYAASYCPNEGIATVTRTGTAGGTYSSAAGLVIDPQTGDIDLQASVAGTYSVSYAVSAVGNCTGYTTTTTVTIKTVLATPGSISGPNDVCPMIGSPVPTTYSISPVPGATFYSWQVPVGTTLVSGQGTTTINVTFDNSFALTHSMFVVTAGSLNACTSSPAELEVLKIVPGIPTVISGPVNVCQFAGQAVAAVYSIDPVDNATSYTWIVSGAATIVSGQGTTSIEVSYLDTFSTGNIKVTANSNCGNRSPRSLNISGLLPAIPSAINGPTAVCSYIGTATHASYTIAPIPNAASYCWTVPANVTLVSGQGTTAIEVLFNNGFITSPIQVKSVANCGTSNNRSLLIIVPAGKTPNAISGPTNACPFIGANNEATYSVSPVSGAGSYLWSMPAGATITSHPGGAGINDTIIKVMFDNNFVAGTEISLRAVDCVPGEARTLTILRGSLSTPGLIAGSINVCPFMVSGTNTLGIPVIYSIRKVVNATSYSWTVPQGAAITMHPAGTGINDTIVEITYDATFISGTVKVAAVNGCGTGAARSLSVSRLIPGTAGYIDILQIADCPERVYTYTLPTMPSNATGILWTVPANAMIISGQGTTSITVSYPLTAVNDVLTARPYNNCAEGNARSINISLVACATQSNKIMKQDLNNKAAVSPVAGELKVKISSNPAVSDFKVQVLTSGKEDVHIRLMDMFGTEVRIMTVRPFENLSFGKDLKEGMYLLEVSQGDKKTTQQLLKL